MMARLGPFTQFVTRGFRGTTGLGRGQSLIDAMMETFRDREGDAPATPRVDEPAASLIVVLRPKPGYPDAPLMKPEVVINTEILDSSDELIRGWEGCFNISVIRGTVPRHRHILVRYRPAE